MKVVWTETAVAHLESIHEFIAKTSPLYAHLMVRRLWDRTGQIEAFRNPAVRCPNIINRMFEKSLNPPTASSTVCTNTVLRSWQWCTLDARGPGWKGKGGPPNKRLKLAGAYRSNGSECCTLAGTDFVPHPCAGGRVAPSLSAIR